VRARNKASVTDTDLNEQPAQAFPQAVTAERCGGVPPDRLP
jgi:hypothetical protein